MQVAKRDKVVRKRGKKRRKMKINCSALAENQCIKPSQKSVTQIEKVSTNFRIRNPLKKKKNSKGSLAFVKNCEKQSVSSDKNIEGSGGGIKDNVSESSSLRTNVAGQCPKVHLGSKKLRKSKNEKNKSAQLVKNSKKAHTNSEGFKQISKRKLNHSQEGNMEVKRRRIENINSCKGSENRQNNVKKIEDKEELSSSKKHNISRKQPHNVPRNNEGIQSGKKRNKRNKISTKVLEERKKNVNGSRASVNEDRKKCVNLNSSVEDSGRRNKDNSRESCNSIMEVAKCDKVVRKRGKKTCKRKINCSAPAENQRIKPSQKSVTQIEKVSTDFRMRNPLKKKKNSKGSLVLVKNDEKQSVSSDKNVKESGGGVKDNLSESNSLKTKESGQSKKVRLRSKKRRKSKNLNKNGAQLVENSKIARTDLEGFKQVSKRKLNDSQEDNVEAKRRRIKSYNSCGGSGRQKGMNSQQYISPAKKQSINLTSNDQFITTWSGNGQNQIMKFEDNEELPSSKKNSNSRKEPHIDPHNNFSEGTRLGKKHNKRSKLEGKGELHFTKKFNQNISQKEAMSSPSNRHSIQTGNGQNKILKFENDDGDMRLTSSKKFNGIDSNKQYRDLNRSKHSNKMLPKLENKKMNLIKSEKEIASSKLDGNGELHFTKKFNHNISKKETMSSPSDKHSIQTGNGQNKIQKFDDADGNIEFRSSKKFNGIDSNKLNQDINRSKHSNKMLLKLENKKKNLIKSEKEIASNIYSKNEEENVDNVSLKEVVPFPKTKTKNDSCLSLRQRMLCQLKSSRFRYLNQQLYTSDSNEANALFQKDPDLFKNYHEGFKRQVEQWPINPIDRIIKGILRRPADLVVADFGCGDAKLAKSVPNKVHSFDLVALSDEVTVCDMANTPLKDASVDICVFCLSLMGTNLESFITEANRVLKMSGVLKIAEVASRFEKVETFIKDLKKYGFAFSNKDFSHNLFYFMNFTKSSNITKLKDLPCLHLKPCMYKKR